MTDEEADHLRKSQSKAVARAVAGIASKLGFAPDVVLEGAIRGGCALLLERGDSHDDVARLLEQSARMIRALAQDNGSVI